MSVLRHCYNCYVYFHWSISKIVLYCFMNFNECCDTNDKVMYVFSGSQ